MKRYAFGFHEIGCLLFHLYCAITPGLPFRVSLTWKFNTSASALTGATASLVCSWLVAGEEVPISAYFFSPSQRSAIGGSDGSSNNNKRLLTFDLESSAAASNSAVVTGNTWQTARMAFVPLANKYATSVRFAIAGVRCADEGDYTCLVSYQASSTDFDTRSIVTTRPLHVQLSSPRMNVTSEDGLDALLDGSEVTFHCSALVGRNDTGRFHWTMERRTGLININEEDDRVEVFKEPYDCTTKGESNLTLTLKRDDDNFVVSCYVINEEFAPESSQLVNCKENALCARTETLRVFHPVIESTVTVSSETNFALEGDTAEFNCRAEGLPEPEITWSKDNAIVPGEGSGVGSSNLILLDVNIAKHSGVYVCTASNTIGGKRFSVSKEIHFAVKSLPPTEPGLEGKMAKWAAEVEGWTSQKVDRTTLMVIVGSVSAVLLLVVLGRCYRNRATT